MTSKNIANLATTASLQLWSVGLGGMYKQLSTPSASPVKLEIYLNAVERSSAT